MQDIVFIEKNINDYSDWKGLDSSGQEGVKHKEIDDLWHLIIVNGETQIGTSDPAGDVIDLIESLSIIDLTKSLPNECEPAVIACHQGLIAGEKKAFCQDIKKKWGKVKVYEYSIGHGYVCEFGEKGTENKPIAKDDDKELTITQIIKQKKYALIPKLLDLADGKSKKDEIRDNISNLQLYISALKILLRVRQAADRVGAGFAESLGKFFRQTAGRLKDDQDTLGVARLEQEFAKFQQDTKELPDDKEVRDIIAACDKIIKLLENPAAKGNRDG